MQLKVCFNKTTMLKDSEVKSVPWFIIDATNVKLGRMASVIASILLGKVSTRYTANVACGGGVVVINARHVMVSGNKALNKKYHVYSGYIGGAKTLCFEDLIRKNPTYIIRHAIKGMLPKNILTHRLLSTRLKVYAGNEHNMHSKELIPV